MLSYEDFAEEIRNQVKEKLGAGYEVLIQKERKPNMGIGYGLEIFNKEEQEREGHFAIHLGQLFRVYRKEGTLQGIAWEIAKRCQEMQARLWETEAAIQDIGDYGKCKDRIYYRMVNTAKNREMLEDTPHKDILDLSAVPYILVSEDAKTTGNIRVSNNLVKKWGVSAGEVMGQAFANAPKIMPAAEISTVGDILAEAGLGNTVGRLPGLCVLTNKKMIHGFSVIFYQGVLKAVAEKFEEGFYILPSSVHEALIVLDSMGISPRGLKETVGQVNRENVGETERLSDSIYHYDREKDELMIITG